MDIYSMDVEAVEPVFYAVVPDSFMNRASSEGSGSPFVPGDSDWPEETDLPLVSPKDPWSF